MGTFSYYLTLSTNPPKNYQYLNVFSRIPSIQGVFLIIIIYQVDIASCTVDWKLILPTLGLRDVPSKISPLW